MHALKPGHALAALAIATATGSAYAEPVRYDVEPTHAFVHFEAVHSGASTNRGRFDQVEGSITLDKAAQRGSVDITVMPGSVNTGIDSYNNHLRGSDFLDTSKFPQARFVGDGFVFANDNVQSVSGTLTLLGKSVPVTLSATRFRCYNSRMFDQREVCGGDFETVLQRSAFGMNYGLPGIPDDIRILIQIEALRAQ